MTSFEFTEDDLHDIVLEPVQRSVLGAGTAVDPQTKRVTLGALRAVLVDPATPSDDIKPFLAGRDHSTFTQLNVVVGFAHEDDNPFESAWIDIRFGGVDGSATAAEPTVWAMQPLSDSDPNNVTKKIGLTASLKFGPVEVSPGVNAEKSQSYVQSLVKVEATGEGTAAPRWRFYPTETSPIRGTHRLIMLVETATGAAATATVSVGATIKLRRLKVFRFEGAPDDLPADRTCVVPPPGLGTGTPQQ